MSLYPRIDEWRTWMQAQGLSILTINARCERATDLAVFLQADPSDATSDDVVRYLADLGERVYRGKTMTRSSLATYHSHIKAWFAWLVRVDYRTDDPCAKVKAPKVNKRLPRPVTNREFQAIFAVTVHRRTHMMLLLAAWQGLRVHEIAKIRGEDVNLLDRQLRVVGKGGVDAILTLDERVAAEAVRYPRKGYWFPAHRGLDGHVNARSVSNILGDVFDRAGVDGGAHRLRHWYATTLLNGGVANIRDVQGMMRHASIQSTELYTAINTDRQKAAQAALSLPDTAA